MPTGAHDYNSDCLCASCQRTYARRAMYPVWFASFIGFALLALLVFTLGGCTTYTPSRPPPVPGPSQPPVPGQALDVQVADVDGPPLPGAVVKIQDNQNAGRTATANSLGRALLTGLIVPSDFTLCATAEGYVESCVGVLLRTSSNVTIPLGRVVTVPTVPTAGFAGSLRVVGRSWVNDAGIFRPLFVTSFGTLSQLIAANEPAAIAFMDWAKATGFNGLRFIAGNVGWLNDQRAAQARAVLPRALELAKDRGLYVEVTALTGTGRNPFDKAAHIKSIWGMCATVGNCLLELANEPYHGSQDSATRERSNLLAWGKGSPVPFALGAAERDEVIGTPKAYPMAGGSYITVHLKRAQDWAIQIGRLNELHTVSATHGVPVMDNEKIGWGEIDTGSRLTNPSAFFMAGAFARVMELGTVGHGEHALRSLLPGPKQQACAVAFVAGIRAVESILPAGQRATLVNGHWTDRTPASGRFVFVATRGETWKADGTGTKNRVWRITSGLVGNKAAVIVAGINGDPGLTWVNGYRPVRLVAEYPAVQIYEATK